MKLTNTWKHLQGGCVAAVAIVVVEWLLHYVNKASQGLIAPQNSQR